MWYERTKQNYLLSLSYSFVEHLKSVESWQSIYTSPGMVLWRSKDLGWENFTSVAWLSAADPGTNTAAFGWESRWTLVRNLLLYWWIKLILAKNSIVRGLHSSKLCLVPQSRPIEKSIGAHKRIKSLVIQKDHTLYGFADDSEFYQYRLKKDWIFITLETWREHAPQWPCPLSRVETKDRPVGKSVVMLGIQFESVIIKAENMT